ncbi:ATP-binding protein [Merismopedia glauca]|uniref:9-O-acetyl-N-acetylneuraminate esterase n=1 Tax=Merismopedia glauca CCAP 1448/3 TaxID=1296344 RepID=A0A2T1C9H9_9CYAN|nr:ATP-binding protein [Merismopedia glauca]PSB04932.1 9-O-acetyl-N-acetylneuraminate esterase [Merismopedia glauca CCAP 1448/3]
MTIKRHRRTLKNGSQRTYTYAVNEDGEHTQLGVSSDSPTPYRNREKKRIVATMQANSSLLVISEPGGGKTFLAETVVAELKQLGYPVALATPTTVKQTLTAIANQLGVETESIEGKSLNTTQLQNAIAQYYQNHTAFLICDSAHRFPVSLRCFLEELHTIGQPILLFATYPPARDIFLKLPRIELAPLPESAIREIMIATATELGISINPSQIATLQARTGGNPMLARRVVKEEYLGLEDTSPDHTQWIDGTPFLIAFLMVFTVVRIIGLGVNSTTLYLIGGILTVAVGVMRIMVFSLPKKSGRLGQ